MALQIVHSFLSQKADGDDTSLIRPSNWNAAHRVSGTLGTDQLAGDNTWTGDNNFTGALLQNGLPLAIGNSLYVVPNDDPAAPVFDFSRSDIQLFVTNGDITAPTFVNLEAGQRVTIIILVDSGGPRSITWAGNVYGGMILGTQASRYNVQNFVSPDGTILLATSYGVTDLG
ncbi:MAG TPA: hypothetical protein VGN17_25490 [Bryobacteraceae bacterium]|jgi:hypothetical protein